MGKGLVIAMLKYLIQVIENALTAGLLVAGIFSLIRKTDSAKRKRWPIWGGILGFATALVLAVLRQKTSLIKRDQINLYILPIAIFAGLLFIVFAFGFLQKRRPRLHGIMLSFTGSALIALLLFGSLPDIFLYTSEFLMSGQSVFSTDFLFQIIGYVAGLGLVLLTGIALFWVGKNLHSRLTPILICLAILVNIVNQITAFAQILLTRRIIPMADWLFDILLPVINHNVYFLYTVLLITLTIPVILWLQSFRPKDTFGNPAQHRKIKARSRGQRRWSVLVLVGYIFAIFSLTALKAYNEHEIVLSPAEPMQIVGVEIQIPIQTVSDGHLHRFAYTASDGTEMRFIVIKKNEASYGVGLDACDICGATGYYERENEVICKLCDVVMNKSTIGFKGGCNPVPLPFAIANGNMIVQMESLENEKVRFK
ncbi:Fe-S-containing protein [Lachnospiraceae bacterium ZAX-1]